MASGVSLRVFLLKNAKFTLRNASAVEFKVKGCRTFLSDAYKCQEAWDKRLEASLVKKIHLDDMYHEVDQKFQQEGVISAVDVDLFATAVHGDSHLDELEDLVHRLRMSESAVLTLPSTPHSLVRTFLDNSHNDALLRVLNDRLNYGVFPDHYTANLLMDSYLKNKQYLEAAKVGVLQMLQEDWAHSLTTRLSLLSCLQHLLHPVPWDSVGSSLEATDKDEGTDEVKVRVNFLRNPFFDDHFDLKDGQAMVGKTLAMLSPHLPAGLLAQSLELLGLTLYGKLEEASQRLQQWTQKSSGPVVFKQAIEMALASLQEAGKEESSSLQTLLSSTPATEGDLVALVEETVHEAVKQHEASDISKQISLYATWEKAREQELVKQLIQIDTAKRLKKVEEKKQYLLEKEERLYFFDKEQQWDLQIEEKQPRFKKRWFGKKKAKRVLDEGYVPPEVGRNQA